MRADIWWRSVSAARRVVWRQPGAFAVKDSAEEGFLQHEFRQAIGQHGESNHAQVVNFSSHLLAGADNLQCALRVMTLNNLGKI